MGSNTGFVESRALSERRKNWKVLVNKRRRKKPRGRGRSIIECNELAKEDRVRKTNIDRGREERRGEEEEEKSRKIKRRKKRVQIKN